MESKRWVRVCRVEDIELEDVYGFEFEGHTYAVYRTTKGCFATDGICTHEEAYLPGGFVIDDVIECPLHNGRFQIATGKAVSPPACVDLCTYPVNVEKGEIFIGIPQ